MDHGCKYDIKIQVKVIIVMTFLHNFIRMTNPTNATAIGSGQEYSDNQQPETVDYGELHTSGVTKAKTARASQKRDMIAKQMWSDYKKVLRHWQRHGQGPLIE
ncbi:hypothetical protein PtA15_8A170 [Puccinia triticina]|uniref:Uncharacterized protein n=1 Tax=Puccinia triticina TaxID=208348 RepID=A0ABY7CT11_9BASI|nr:uncharacterized protein PtA15_8A170 [Puccinia triticina]WAQ87266.1 hypothetical protein PtA15_8A170 [Puccinia triticina]